MSLEDEILYNIIHLASHFKKGGVGIRFVIDVWVYRQLDANYQKINAELESIGLYDFYKNIVRLAEEWFGTGRHNFESEVIEDMGRFVCRSGIFGDSKNRADTAVSNGKIRYLKRVIFPNYNEMKSMFPWLKNKLLLPLAWIVRGFESIVWRKRNVHLLLHPIATGDTHNYDLTVFYKNCGL